MSNIKWLPLESNPDCLKDFGVPDNWGVSDIISLDDELISMVPTPCLAILLLFPITSKCTESLNVEEVQDAYYMKQTIGNACGTVALIHAVANNEPRLSLKPDSVLKKFLDLTRNLSPEERGRQLEQNMDISTVHESSAQEGQTETPNLDEDVNLHFITIVNINGRLVELDGRKPGPVVHGETTDAAFIKDAFRVCREYMKRDPENLSFNVLSFGALEN